jgi:foldase protein PrsA
MGYAKVMRLLGLAVVVGGLSAVAGCGGGSASSGTIVEVAGRSIDKATLDHWVPIEAIISTQVFPKKPLPAGVVPDPPQYDACMAYLRTSTPLGHVHVNLTPTQLKDACREHYEAVRQHMLQILITFQWLSAEAEKRGLSVSDTEAKTTLARFVREQIGSKQDFERYLKYSRQSLEDEMLVGKMDLLSNKLQAAVRKELGNARAAKFLADWPKRWSTQTSCRPGFIVPDCKQYKGTDIPQAAL